MNLGSGGRVEPIDITCPDCQRPFTIRTVQRDATSSRTVGICCDGGCGRETAFHSQGFSPLTAKELAMMVEMTKESVPCQKNCRL